MSIKLSNINNNAIYSDIDLSFSKNPKTADLLLVYDEKAVKNSVSNLLKTSFGERLFQPQLGSSLRSLLFEPIDQFSSTEIKDRVFDTLTNYEPRIENIIVDVSPNEDLGYYEVDLQFNIRLINITTRFSIILERIR